MLSASSNQQRGVVVLREAEPSAMLYYCVLSSKDSLQINVGSIGECFIIVVLVVDGVVKLFRKP